MSYEVESINARTEKFHLDVIETTIEALQEHFKENHLTEELLERLKADWEKALRDTQIENLEKAKKQ